MVSSIQANELVGATNIHTYHDLLWVVCGTQSDKISMFNGVKKEFLGTFQPHYDPNEVPNQDSDDETAESRKQIVSVLPLPYAHSIWTSNQSSIKIWSLPPVNNPDENEISTLRLSNTLESPLCIENGYLYDDLILYTGKDGALIKFNIYSNKPVEETVIYSLPSEIYNLICSVFELNGRLIVVTQRSIQLWNPQASGQINTTPPTVSRLKLKSMSSF